MNWRKPKVYAVKHKDEIIRAASRSGGVFTALSDEILKDGVVYGCILTKDFQAIHIRAEDTKTRDQMRGSKYIQSRLGDTYRNVKVDLDAGRTVLFSGTSCQVAGLRRFLGKEYEKLLCVDIICYGVPSSMVWKKYLLWQEKKNADTVIEADFRNKTDFGWHNHVETLTMLGGKKVSSSVFSTLFNGRNVLRPSCYECTYKSIMHPGDITIADYWGIEKAAPGFDDNKGVSLVLINGEKGDKYFESVKDKLNWKSTRIEDSMQPALKEVSPRPKEREVFWRDLLDKDFNYIAKKYGGYGLKNKIKRKLGSLKCKIFR